MPWAPRCSSPPEMMPAPMPVRDLDEHQVVDVGQVGVLLPQRHDVHVVVDEHRDVEGPLHVAGHVVAVPARHDRRVDRAAGGVLDRTGQADADRRQLADVAALVGEQLARSPTRPSRARAPGRSATSSVRARSASTGRPGRRAPAVACVAPMSTPATTRAPGFSASSEGGRPPVDDPAERRDQAEPHQRVDPGGDGRPGEPGGLGELGAGPGLPVAQQLEEVTGLHAQESTTQDFRTSSKQLLRVLDKSA